MSTALREKHEPGLAADDLIAAIRRSGILTPGQLKDLSSRVAAGRYPSDPTRIGARLVRNGVLTEYQARHLLHGRPDWLSIGRYVILDRLGKGSMGRVYKARHRMMGRIVALKVVSSDCPPRKGGIRRFLREMRLVGRLDHPHIVRALDADQLQGFPYIVMEYVAGQTLDQLLRARGPLPPLEVAQYARQAALGLNHAHEQGVIHRDVKPTNLIVDRHGALKILDLGLGSLMEGDDDEGAFATAAGIVVGTVEYISPEAAAGRAIDGRSDLYSLGCTMYHLLSDRLPFPGDSKVERLAQRIQGRAKPITKLCPGLSPRLVAIVERLMANRPADRYSTAQEAAEALQSYLQAEGPDEALLRPLRAGPPTAPGCDLEMAQSSALFRSAGSSAGSGLVPRDGEPASWVRLIARLAQLPPTVGIGILLAAMAACVSIGYITAVPIR